MLVLYHPYETQQQAVDSLKNDGFEFRCTGPTGELWRNPETGFWRLLKQWKGKWEVQQPQGRSKP